MTYSVPPVSMEPISEMDRNLSLDLVRVTETAALSAARWMGRGNKENADRAAVDAMREVLNGIEMEGIVVIGEGEKDHAPMLYTGEVLGSAERPKVDIAVDPIDGTRLLADGRPNSLCVLAVAERGSMYGWQDLPYMEKIVVGPSAKGAIDLEAPVADNLARVAAAKGTTIPNLTVLILDRPRHTTTIREVRETGARIRLMSDGDVAGALLAAREGSGIDMLLGVGGSPEAVIAACALKCLGGEMQCRVWPRDQEERDRAKERGIDIAQIHAIDDLVRGNDVFFAATGITDGELLQGVKYLPDGAHTHSLVMRGLSGTVRDIRSTHRLSPLSILHRVKHGLESASS
ncbi:MAG: class II fructose-bisphosphatase [Thermomicrobiales bacterium]